MFEIKHFLKDDILLTYPETDYALWLSGYFPITPFNNRSIRFPVSIDYFR